MELILLLLFIIGIIRYYLDKKKYDSSEYKKESGNEYFEVRKDKGKFGEYQSFNKLERIKGEHRILTNVYLPKGNGETTEIDLIYIHETGIYVIESKNYSGWIYGSEKNKFWTQVLNNRRKNKFYNPIWQNNTHIKYLSKVLSKDEKDIKSIIVFSERCTLKRIEVISENVKVINRYNLNKQIEKFINNSNKIFESGEIIKMYYELKPYTCMSNEEKQIHVNSINSKINKNNNFKITEKKDINYDELIYKELKEYRLNKSREEKIKPYFIYSNSELEEIVKNKPKTIYDLNNIKGFGKIKCNKYGEDILKIINKY